MVLGLVPANATDLSTASIAGTVTVPAGVDPGGVQVTAYTADYWYAASASVGPSGSYSLTGLAAGSYKIRFSGYGAGVLDQWHKDGSSFNTATAVSVTAGQKLTGIDATLVKSASISGRITAPAGVSLVNANVRAQTANNQYGGSAPVGSDGSYSLRGLAAGSYKINFSGYNTGAVDQWYKGASSFATATAVSVTAGQDLTGIDATLVKGASITGVVTGADGPISAPVSVLNSAGEVVRNGYSDRVGAYSISGLASGTYKVAFNRASGPSLAEAQFYQNKPESSGLGSAQTLTVQEGNVLGNIDAVLAKGGSVSGTLLDKARLPLPYARVWFTRGMEASSPVPDQRTRTASSTSAG